MAMNTPYLGSSATPGDRMNTSYISTGLTEITSALSVWGPVSFLNSAVTLGGNGAFTTVSASSNLTVGGVTTLSSAATIIGPLNVNSGHTQANFLSYQTTASATSLNLPDGAFGVYFLSTTSMALAFRSGNTTYTVRATAASVL